MVENLFETHYDVTKKSKIKRFYETNKILIFIVIFIFLFSFASIGFYLNNRENKIILLSNNYIEAKVLLENGKKEEATKILKNVSGIGFTYFDESDIVRHPLVKKIIGAYDTIDKKNGTK